MERLQKILAQAGIASRRKAEQMILDGRVRVNDRVVTELGTKVDADRDKIFVDDRAIRLEKHLYLLLNKPRGYISDTDDTAERPPALELVGVKERLFPVGRLDWNSEGALLLTNDGEVAFRLTHPRYEHTKEYLVLVIGEVDESALASLRRGIFSEGEWLRADKVERAPRHQPFGEASRAETWLKFILHEGKKRHLRRMCAAVGHPVRRLIRTRIATVKLGELKAGKWRALTTDEIQELKTSLAEKNGKWRMERGKGKSKVQNQKRRSPKPSARDHKA